MKDKLLPFLIYTELDKEIPSFEISWLDRLEIYVIVYVKATKDNSQLNIHIWYTS